MAKVILTPARARCTESPCEYHIDITLTNTGDSSVSVGFCAIDGLDESAEPITGAHTGVGFVDQPAELAPGDSVSSNSTHELAMTDADVRRISEWKTTCDQDLSSASAD